MGAVDVGSSALEEIMVTGALSPRRNRGIAKMVGDGRAFTSNQKMMARSAGLHSTDAGLRRDSLTTLLDQIGSERVYGPMHWELLAPFPHGEMYYLARCGILAAWAKAQPDHAELHELGARTAEILGYELRIAALVARPGLVDPCRGLPGMRAPNGSGLGRPGLSGMWTEWRRAQGDNIEHLGPKGRTRRLKWDAEDSDPLVDGPAWWLRQILAGPLGRTLLAGFLAPAASLPAGLRTSLTVWRWPNNTLAALGDPGSDEERSKFIITGSAAAKKKGGQELPVVWIQVVDQGTPFPVVTAASDWNTALPEVPPDAKKTFIPAAPSKS